MSSGSLQKAVAAFYKKTEDAQFSLQGKYAYVLTLKKIRMNTEHENPELCASAVNSVR